MGFKRITKKDLEKSLNQKILGNPLKISEELEKDIEVERKFLIEDMEHLTSAQIVNEEVARFSYYNSGRLKDIEGYGIPDTWTTDGYDYQICYPRICIGDDRRGNAHGWCTGCPDGHRHWN